MNFSLPVPGYNMSVLIFLDWMEGCLNLLNRESEVGGLELELLAFHAPVL
jgi:hypothetical protein